MVHLVRVALILAALAAPAPAHAGTERADVALVLAIDVSESIDSSRYTLQMEGIAKALEAPEVQASILAGPNGALLVTMVQWSSRPNLTLPWTLVASREDANRLATRIRAMPRAESGFTCMSAALRNVADAVLTRMTMPADRQVVDVSGDGRDNCNPEESVDHVRDVLAASGVAVNGLPILEGDEATTLEAWYRAHVAGGPNSFLLPAKSFDDFEQAFRRKFLTEVSGLAPSGNARAASR